MSTEQAAKSAEAAPAAPRRSKLPFLIIAGLMAVEGVAVFAVAKFLMGTPAAAHGAEAENDAHFDDAHVEGDAPPTAEIEITQCRPNNSVTGRLVTFKLRVSALILRPAAERAEALIKSNEARISDRINVVIRSAEAHELSEPGLETIRRRLKHELDTILGDEHLVQEVLIPELLQSGTGL